MPKAHSSSSHKSSADKPVDEHGDSQHKKEKRHPHKIHHVEEGEEGEPWLLSYADMVTLLMCFFILFFTLDKRKGAVSDPERIASRLAKAVALDATAAAASAQGNGDIKSIRRGMSSELYKMSSQLKVVFALSQPDPESLSMTFLNSNFFATGSVELSDDAKLALGKVAEKLKLIKSENLIIEVDGHTDSSPLGRTSKYATNWELSTARAASVVRYLISCGLPGGIMKASGFADQQPLVKERDERGVTEITAQKLNRRVEIRLKNRYKREDAPPPAAKPEKGGVKPPTDERKVEVK